MKKLILLLSVLFVVSCSPEPILYMLTTSVSPVDTGVVIPSTRQYNEGDTATLIATPAAEYVFDKWTGAEGGSETTIVMSSDKTVVANFIKKKYALTVNIEGEGTVTEKIIKAGAATDYNSGTVVELTATGKTGWEFKEWTGDLESTKNPAEITIDASKTIKAVFVKKQFAVNITIEGEGGGTVAEEVVEGLKVDSKYEYGTELKLTANPSSEWVFKEWKGDVTGTENPLQLTIDETKNVTAVFIENFFIYLPFNGSVNDESINNFEIDSNGVELTSDRHGNENSAYLISNGNSGSSGSGAGDLIFSKQNIFTNSLENYTISFWVNFLSNSGSQMVFGLLGGTPDTNGSGGDAFNYKGNTLSNYRSTHTESTGWDVLARSTYGTLDINKWYNVSLIRDGDNLFYYLNGEKVKTITGLNNYDFENNKTRLKIGNNTYNYKNGEWTSYIEQMKGKIDEVIKVSKVSKS